MKVIANGFAVELPKGWDDRSLITLAAPTSANGFAPNVVVTRERIPANVSIEAYAQAQRTAMKEEVPALEILDERATTINGAPAFQRLQRFTMEGQQLQQAQTYVLAQGLVFVITGTAAIADFDNQIPAFRQIIESFRLFDPEASTI